MRKWEHSNKSYCSILMSGGCHGAQCRSVMSSGGTKVFLTNKRCDDAKLLTSDEWYARLAYMADIFQHLNERNTRMQGRNENRLTNADKINGFHSKVQLWQQHVESTNLGMFPLTQKWEGVNTAALCETIGKNLKTLEQKLSFYFSSIILH